jgi:hypothetical protein
MKRVNTCCGKLQSFLRIYFPAQRPSEHVSVCPCVEMKVHGNGLENCHDRMMRNVMVTLCEGLRHVTGCAHLQSRKPDRHPTKQTNETVSAFRIF